ncbi:hypothetical protein [Clostridium saccharobutylicum]|uniref:hypothetical protein n=1 Tax=Clostridium saccharobutylicum TaxID=169679 RepID=UPI0017D4D0B9|nr:uncharacterized protein YceK [Clostridium saccharobutylicum]
MKRIQIILSVAVMLITLSGCGNQKVQSNDSTKDTAITTDNQENTTTDIKDNNVAAQKDSDNTNSNKKIVQTQILIKQKRAQIIIPVHKILLKKVTKIKNHFMVTGN